LRRGVVDGQRFLAPLAIQRGSGGGGCGGGATCIPLSCTALVCQHRCCAPCRFGKTRLRLCSAILFVLHFVCRRFRDCFCCPFRGITITRHSRVTVVRRCHHRRLAARALVTQR
jgi:hypothetical protein